MQKRGITRKSWGPNPIWIIPTDTTSGMILANRKDELIAKWQPIASDLLANDWTIYG
ncbi:Thoeris anti-defense Tad2 family protein [Pediococcus acidilactici]